MNVTFKKINSKLLQKTFKNISLYKVVKAEISTFKFYFGFL